MPDRYRALPNVMSAPIGDGEIVPCRVMTQCMISTLRLPEGHFAAIALAQGGQGHGVLAVLDREEVERHIQTLRNAMDDAERADRGEEMVHALIEEQVEIPSPPPPPRPKPSEVN